MNGGMVFGHDWDMKICMMKQTMGHGGRIRYAIRRHGVINGIYRCTIGEDYQWILYFRAMTVATHSFSSVHSAGLRCCSPASRMSHCADGRRARGGAGRWAARGGVSLMNAQAYPPAEGCPQSGCPSRGARSTAARSASGPYHVPSRRGRLALSAAVAGRPPYRAGGRVSSRAVRIRFSGNNAIVMPQILSKYVRWCCIIHVVLCNRMGVDCIRYCNLNALFDIMVGKGETNG